MVDVCPDHYFLRRGFVTNLQVTDYVAPLFAGLFQADLGTDLAGQGKPRRAFHGMVFCEELLEIRIVL